MIDFVLKYVLFRHQGDVLQWGDLITSGYIVGIIFWLGVMFLITQRDRSKFLAALWSQGLGHILFLEIVMGGEALEEYNRSIVHLFPLVVYSLIAVLGYRLFIKESFSWPQRGFFR